VKDFIAWLKAIFTRTKETNVSDMFQAATTDASDVSLAAAANTATGAVDSGAVADAAASVAAAAIASAAAVPVAVAPVTAAPDVVPADETTDDAAALAAAVEARVAAVLASLKDVLTYAKVEVEHVWDESVAFAKKLA